MDDDNFDDIPVRDPGSHGYQPRPPSGRTGGGAATHFDDKESEIKRAQHRRAVSGLPREELEDKYLRLMDENVLLKKHARKQEEKIKKMATKLLRLVSDRKKQSQEQDVGAGPKKPRGRDLEMEETLEELQGKVRDLEKQNDMMKNKLMVAKQQLAMQGKRSTTYNHVQSRINTGMTKAPTPDHIKKGLRVQGERSTSATPRAFRNDVLPRYGHSLLEEARAENQRLEEEIMDLQDHVSVLQQEKEVMHEQLHIKELELEETMIKLKEQMSAGQRHHAKSNIQENVDMIRLQREIQEKSTKLVVLEAQYATLQENLNTVKTSHDAVLAEMEELNKSLQNEQGKVITLQAELKQTSTLQRNIQELKDRAADLEKEKEILREANEKLLSSAFDAERERQYRANEKQLRLQIAQLEATLKGDLNDKNTLLDKLNEERDEYEKLQKENREMQVKYYQCRQQLEELQEKMRFFTKESALDWQELEEALILVKKRKERGNENLEFLEKVEEEVNKDLKMQLAQLQADHAETVNELEKTRNMLLLQHKINQDYQQEVEQGTRRMEDYQVEYETKLQEYAQLLDIRGARIKKLEHQLKDVAYGTKQYKVTEPSHDDIVDEIDETIKLERGQNLLELHIEQIVFSQEGLRELGDDEPQTFATYEFFEFELQSTPVLKGNRPKFNFTSQYKVTVDDFFLHHLMKGSTTLELHQAIGTEFRTVAACQLRFRDLLDKPQGRVHTSAQLLGVESGHAGMNFGTLEYWVRLRVPMEQALRLFRERIKALGYLTSNQTAAQQALATMEQTEGSYEEGVNELIIRIIRCNDIKARREGVQPNPYAVYRFFDFNDHDTTIVSSSNSPEFNDNQVYPVPINIDLDRYLRSECLEVFLFDDSDPEETAYLGAAKIPLISLAHDKQIRGTFELKQTNGKINGHLDAFLKWQRPYVAPKLGVAKTEKAIKQPTVSAYSLPSKPPPAGKPPLPVSSAKLSSKGLDFTPTKETSSGPAFTSTPKDEGRHQSALSPSLAPPKAPELTQITEETKDESLFEAKPAVVPAITISDPSQESASALLEEEVKTLEKPKDDMDSNRESSAESLAQGDEVEKELTQMVEEEGKTKDLLTKDEEEQPGERLEDLVAQELREQFGETTMINGKTGAYNDTMFEEAPIPEEDEDEESSIAEEVDIPVSGEKDDEVSEKMEGDEDEVENDNLAGTREKIEEDAEVLEGEDGGSTDSEVVMTPTVKRPHSTVDNEDTVIVAIYYLSLEADSPVMSNEEVSRLYIEYRFLGVPPEETETPYSLPKPKPYQHLAFNFRKVFHVDAESHKLQRDYLASMLLPEDPTHGRLRFSIVSEPPEDQQDLECEDIGFCFVDLPQLLKDGRDIREQDLDIFDAKNESEIIGSLNVTIECVAALRAVNADLQRVASDGTF